MLSFLLVLAGAAVTGFGGRWWLAICGGILIALGNALDGVDGEVARVSLRTSRRGALLDTILDRYADLAVLAGLALAAGGGPAAWTWAFAAGAAAMLIPYINALVPAPPDLSGRSPCPPRGHDLFHRAVGRPPTARLLGPAILQGVTWLHWGGRGFVVTAEDRRLVGGPSRRLRPSSPLCNSARTVDSARDPWNIFLS